MKQLQIPIKVICQFSFTIYNVYVIIHEINKTEQKI